MRILATVTRPTGGRVLWRGEDLARHPGELRRVLGYLPQDFGIYPNLSAREFLEYLAAVKGLAGRSARVRIAELLELVNLAAAGRRPLGSYSGGMRQRVGIAQALLNDPRLLIVDEPTVGLDPEERVRFRGLLSELAGERIVILSTHIVSDVEAAATEIAVVLTLPVIDHSMMTMDYQDPQIPAGEFKAHCLRLLEEVARTGSSFVVTKRGRPVARVVPVAGNEPPSLAGSILEEGDLISPVGETWESDR